MIAELGMFMPTDDLVGSVVWLRGQASGRYLPIRLAGGIGRVADAQRADFDEDGDLDLVVAEFGWKRTGRILLLENRGIAPDRAEFALHVLDDRHGTTHVPVTNLNGDGHLDFVALISQEHEVLEAFLSDGANAFERPRIYQADDPAYASTDIELVDLDSDGDLDVLYANAGSFDFTFPKPYHAVQWLEKRLSLQIPFAGSAARRQPRGDLDGDGDLDVVAAAIVYPSTIARYGADEFDSVIWF